MSISLGSIGSASPTLSLGSSPCGAGASPGAAPALGSSSPLLPLPWPPPPPQARRESEQLPAGLSPDEGRGGRGAGLTAASESPGAGVGAALPRVPEAPQGNSPLRDVAERRTQCAFAALEDLTATLEAQRHAFGNEAAELRRHFFAIRQAARRGGGGGPGISQPPTPVAAESGGLRSPRFSARGMAAAAAKVFSPASPTRRSRS